MHSGAGNRLVCTIPLRACVLVCTGFDGFGDHEATTAGWRGRVRRTAPTSGELMQRWEYFTTRLDIEARVSLHDLDHWGDEGWEAVSLVPSTALSDEEELLRQNMVLVLFKRPLPGPE